MPPPLGESHETDSFTELVKKTLASRPPPKGVQGKAKDKSK
jgi:hypothetical protein